MRNLIFENFISNSNTKISTDFDFTKSIATNQKIANFKDYNIQNLPIEPNESSWETISDATGTFMYRKYKFKKMKSLIYFVTESLKYAETINHHPEILIIGDEVEVTLTTHDIGDVTNLDIKMSAFMSETFDDIVYIG